MHHLSLIFSEELEEAPEPYERLLGDALQGNSSHFTREDGVEEMWRIVQPAGRAAPRRALQAGDLGADAGKLLAGHPAGATPGYIHTRRREAVCGLARHMGLRVKKLALDVPDCSVLVVVSRSHCTLPVLGTR